MMTYDFKCPKCGTKFTTRMCITKYKRPFCSKCGEEMQRVFDVFRFILKGTGWPGKMNRREPKV